MSNTKRYWRFQHIGWRKLAIFLLIASVVTIVAPWAIYALGLILPTGEAAWGFLLLTPLWYAGVVIAAVNIFAAIAYLLTNKSGRNAFLVCGIAIAVSAAHLAAILR